MLVREKMKLNPITIDKQASIAHAVEKIHENSIRRLPVMDGNKLIGVVSDRDLIEFSPSPASSLSMFEVNYLLNKTKVSDILPKKQLITIGPDDFVEDAALLMRNHKIGGIPVVEKGKLVGIITESNIFDAIIDIMGLRQDGFRLTVKVGKQDRLGILAEVASIIASCGGNITHVSTYRIDGIISTVFRINQGSPEEIQDALEKMGYEVSVSEKKQKK